MIFNQWLKMKAAELEITRKYLAEVTGINYRTLQTTNTFRPRLDNLVILCEVMNKVQEGDKESFDGLIIEAIAACIKDYEYAVKRLEEGK